MTETHCPSCGYRIATPAVPARCPRCGDPLTAPDADTVTHVPQPEAALPPTVSPGDATAAREPGPAAPSSRFPSVPGYELLEVIGRGGMGVVYKARQLSPRRIVALKMIPGGRAERFSTEVAAVARLQHPNVVHIHEVGAVAGRPFFSMEYVPGGTLATHMRGKPLPPRAAAELVAQLARGVQHAHERGVVHRDLKPANILLGAELGARSAELKAGEENGGDSFDSAFRVPRSALLPKIADFGLAKYLDGSADGSGPQTQSGAILGTPNYMAPEQARGKTRDVGPGADVYALGAILYECLTGRPPFREESPVDTLMKVVSDDPKPPRKICRAVPRDLEVICMKCLRKNPRERYTAGELADDLERFLDGQPILARPRTAREQLAGWARRRRGFLLVAAGAALVAVVALAFADRSPRRPAFPAPVPSRPPVSLPPDLCLVPPDAFAFATARAADLWQNPVVRELFGHLSRDPDVTLDSLGKEIERQTSIHPSNIERATFVLPGENGKEPPLIILTTVEPYSHDRLHDMLVQRGRHMMQEVDGKVMYVPNQLNDDPGFLAFDDHILVMGNPELVEKAAAGSGLVNGPLTPMLVRAAREHTAVFGVHPSAETTANWLVNVLRVEPEADVAVRSLQTVGAAIDVSHPTGENGHVTIGVGGWVGFPGTELAQAALPSIPRFARAFVEQTTDRLDFLPPGLLAPLLAPVKDATWRCDGDTLHATAPTGFDLAVLKARLDETRLRDTSTGNMKRIARAMQAYHDKHGRFPPAVVTDADGKPLYSWRVLLLPYLGEDELYRRFHLNRAWDHPSNRPLLDRMPAVFAAPGTSGDKATHYQVLTGPGGLFDSPDGRSLGEVTDGASLTILFVEAPDAVAWSRPADVAFDPTLPKLGDTGLRVALADGRVRSIPPESATPALLRGLFTRAGGEMVTPP